jgi:hypothetical protein
MDNLESNEPVTGFVSQNCVCRSWPPGELKQHEALALATQLSWGFVHVAEAAAAPVAAESKRTETARREAILYSEEKRSQEQWGDEGAA